MPASEMPNIEAVRTCRIQARGSGHNRHAKPVEISRFDHEELGRRGGVLVPQSTGSGRHRRLEPLGCGWPLLVCGQENHHQPGQTPVRPQFTPPTTVTVFLKLVLSKEGLCV